jgi:sugar lactone lactonase YvrE
MPNPTPGTLLINKVLLLILAIFIIPNAIAQSVGIGTSTPNTSARLEVNSTTQGILIPTLTTAQRSAISSPATGLLVFQTDGTPGFYYYTGAAWVNLTNGYQVNNQGMALSSSYGLTSTLAAASSFSLPTGVAVDASGNIYVAAKFAHEIRKISSTGVVTTLAGSGTAGSANGTGTAASFYNPTGVAVDVSGNIYVADKSNHKIRKITAAGVVTTLAGSGTAGSADGTGTAATFNNPAGVAVDASGNIYVADKDNHKIRKITAAGVVTTLAGSGTDGSADGTGTAATFSLPEGVAVDASGNIYLADTGNDKIRKITAAAVVTTLAGSGTAGSTDGTGTAATFDLPTGVAVDAFGNIYVADQNNHKIRKITSAGVVTTLAGSGTDGLVDGTGTAAFFYNPTGVAVDVFGNIYVADTRNSKIRKIIAQ